MVSLDFKVTKNDFSNVFISVHSCHSIPVNLSFFCGTQNIHIFKSNIYLYSNLYNTIYYNAASH